MRTRTDYHFNTIPVDRLTVTSHVDSVSLHLSSVFDDSDKRVGFSLEFTEAHLPKLRELVDTLGLRK